MLSVVVARSSSDYRAICHVLPVLWMTSCFSAMGHTVRGVGNTDVVAVLEQEAKISNVLARGCHAVGL